MADTAIAESTLTRHTSTRKGGAVRSSAAAARLPELAGVSGVVPPLVLRGTKTQIGQFPTNADLDAWFLQRLQAVHEQLLDQLNSGEVDVSVGIDWVRVTGPVFLVHRLRAYLDSAFGPSCEEIKGRWFFDAGERRPDCVDLLWHDDSTQRPIHERQCCVDIPGSALASLGPVVALEVLHDLLSMGCRSTRIDGRVDVRCRTGASVGLIDSVAASCEAGELVRARTFEVIQQTRSRELIGRGVTIGRRGSDGSGRYVRVYDKGLETKTEKPGVWERFEVEFSGDVAAQVAIEIAKSDRPADTITAHTLGAVEFRENTGRSELSRRPLVAWYAELLGKIEPECVSQIRTQSTLGTWAAWFSECVAPTIKDMAECAGQTPDQVMSYFTDQWQGVTSRYASPEKRPLSFAYVRERSLTLEPKPPGGAYTAQLEA